YETPDGIFTAVRNNLGDLPLHLQVINSFAQGHNLPPEDPTFAGVRFAYPFMTDFLAAMLVKGAGADVISAMWAENMLPRWRWPACCNTGPCCSPAAGSPASSRRYWCCSAAAWGGPGFFKTFTKANMGFCPCLPTCRTVTPSWMQAAFCAGAIRSQRSLFR